MASFNADEGGATRWWRRPSLSRRIAVVMALSLAAVMAQAFALIYLLSNPEFRLTGTRWLAETTHEAVREGFAVPPERRDDLLRKKSAGSPLKLRWSADLDTLEQDESDTALAARLAATLRDVLGDSAKTIHITASTLSYRFPVNSVGVIIVPDEIGARLSVAPVRADEPDVLMPAGVRIWVQGHDNSWIGIEPIGFDDGEHAPTLPLAPLLGGGILIALVSVLLARRLVAPLDRLIVAAERIGTAREPVKVETAGMHEFAAVSRAFEDMQQRLLRFVEDRTQMLAAISHDLRSSLTRLRLGAEQCRNEAERAALSNEIDDMQSMVESTLAFATGEAQLAPNQPTDIAALLISLVDEAVDAGGACTYDGPNHVETMAHPVSLKRAFRNVIDNALKYGKYAQVSLAVDETSLLIRIQDEGPGIPVESMEVAFSPFRRLDPARGQDIPGAGLGLTIARDVLQSHGGTISLENPTGKGLAVIITLPRR